MKDKPLVVTRAHVLVTRCDREQGRSKHAGGIRTVADQFIMDRFTTTFSRNRSRACSMCFGTWIYRIIFIIHVVLVVEHPSVIQCATSSTILRAFLQTLASSYDPALLPIPMKLQMCLSLESRLRFEGLSLPRACFPGSK